MVVERHHFRRTICHHFRRTIYHHFRLTFGHFEDEEIIFAGSYVTDTTTGYAAGIEEYGHDSKTFAWCIGTTVFIELVRA